MKWNFKIKSIKIRNGNGSNIKSNKFKLKIKPKNLFLKKNYRLSLNNYNKKGLTIKNNLVPKFNISNIKFFDSKWLRKIDISSNITSVNNIQLSHSKSKTKTKLIIKKNKYLKLNINHQNLKLFLRNIKKEIYFLNKTKLLVNSSKKIDLFFENDIFFYKNNKLIFFEIKNLLIDKINNKIIIRNKIEELLKYNFENLIFGIYSELSYAEILWFIKKVDPKKKFFKIILDKNYLIKKDQKYFKTLNYIKFPPYLNKENVIFIDSKYQIDKTINNIILLPGIKKINNNNDNLYLILIEIFNEIKLLDNSKIYNYIQNNFKLN